MKKTKIFAIIMVISLCLSACGGVNSGAIEESSSMTESQPSIADDVVMSNAGVIQDNNNEGDDLAGDHDGLPEVGIDQDVDWSNVETVESDNGSGNENESDVDEFVENPGIHDGYLHEVGGARFYTEHDINQWLRPDEDNPQYLAFDIRQMFIDILGYGAIYNGSTCDGGYFGSVQIEDPDPTYNMMCHTVTVNLPNPWRSISRTMYDCPPPNEKDYYLVMEDYLYGIHRDLAALLLYTVEQMVANPDGYDAVGDLSLNNNYC